MAPFPAPASSRGSAGSRGLCQILINNTMTIPNSSRSRLFAVFALTCFIFSNPAYSLSVTESSSCAETCGDNRVTYSTDLVCTDSSFNETSKGLKLKNCLLCESTSTAYDSPTQNDIYWFLCMRAPQLLLVPHLRCCTDHDLQSTRNTSSKIASSIANPTFLSRPANRPVCRCGPCSRRCGTRMAGSRSTSIAIWAVAHWIHTEETARAVCGGRLDRCS